MSERPQLNSRSSGSRLAVRTRSRRTSSVGKINFGDAVPALHSMYETKEAKNAAQQRMKELSGSSKTDSDLFKKLWLLYLEIAQRRTWFTPLILMLIVVGVYLASGNRTETNPLYQFLFISYQVGDTDMYGKGIKDLYFVFFYMIFFTFFREFVMDVVIRPWTVKWNITSKHKRNRIMEQVYLIVYYGISGPFGLYIMYNSDLWLFETKTMYRTYPDLTNSSLYKIFYLGQAAFWTQQACVLVLQLEKPRKDRKELVFHHIVTLLLIWSSYVFHFTKMGLAVYITMDVSDFFLALSKTLNYVEFQYTPLVFFFFTASWIYLRHYVNIKILWSVLTEFRTEGNYVLNFATQQYKCWISLPIVFVLIFALQVVNLYWLFLIFRIIYRVIWEGVQKDERSDSDSDEEEYEEDAVEKTTSVSDKKSN